MSECTRASFAPGIGELGGGGEWCSLGSEDTAVTKTIPKWPQCLPSTYPSLEFLSQANGPGPGSLLLLPVLVFLPPERFSGSLTRAETGVLVPTVPIVSTGVGPDRDSGNACWMNEYMSE